MESIWNAGGYYWVENAWDACRAQDEQGRGFAPDVLVTVKLRSYGAAKSEMGLSARQEHGLRKNNRAGTMLRRAHEHAVKLDEVERITI